MTDVPRRLHAPAHPHAKDAEACGKWVLFALRTPMKKIARVPDEAIGGVARWAFHWAGLAVQQHGPQSSCVTKETV